MIYAHRAHNFTSEKIHINILHLGLERFFFTCSFTLNILLMYCLIKTYYRLSLCTGSPLQASKRPGQAILPSDRASLYLIVPQTKLFEVKQKHHRSSRKQIYWSQSHCEVVRLFQQFTPGDHTAEPHLSSGARQDCETV